MKAGKIIRQLVAAALVLSLVSSLFAGCAGKAENQKDAQVGSEAQPKSTAPPRKVTLMTQTFGENPPNDNFILKTIQEATNTVLEIMWVPSTSYKDKVNVVIASGEMPNIMLITDTKASSFITAARQGAFWDVGPYLKDYPIYLSKMDETRLKYIQIDGKVYGLFRYRPLGRSGYVIRKDWLNNLGLKEPETTDDFYTVLKAFTLNDPDKNGKNDTLGGVSEKGHSFGHLIAPFGASNGWYVDSGGKVRPSAEQKEYIEALKFINKLYTEKLINQDFLVASDSGALFKKGNAGVRMGGAVDDMASTWNEILQITPTAQFDGVAKLKGPAGAKIYGSGEGNGGMYVFPKTSSKTENDIKAMLGFFDKLCDMKAVGNLLKWGKEGDHFTLTDGNKASRTQAQNEKWGRDSYSLAQLGLGGDDFMPGAYVNASPVQQRVNELYARNESPGSMVPDPTLGLDSPTWNERRADLRKILDDARGKFIIGSLDEAGYMKEIEKFYQNGGTKVCEEFTQELSKSKK